MIAQAIGGVGLMLACLLPLLLAAYVIRAVNRDGDDNAALSITEQTLADGSIKLTVQIGGAA